MFATAVIVFREVLEAALLVGIVAAATRAVPGRNRWLAMGIAAGIAGAGLVALGTERIADMASGIGQELFNAAVLGLAIVMLAWHNLWMSANGAALAADARDVGSEISAGRRARSVLLIVVGLAVLREGSETVLFLYGIAASGGRSLGVDADGRRCRHRRGHGGRVLALCRAAAHSVALVLCGDRRAGAVRGRRHGVAGCAPADPGRCSAEPRDASVGHLGICCRRLRSRGRCCTASSATRHNRRACSWSSTSSC